MFSLFTELGQSCYVQRQFLHFFSPGISLPEVIHDLKEH